MDTPDVISLVAVVAVFVTTVVGWVVTYRTQRLMLRSQDTANRSLSELQGSLVFSREQLQVLINEKLTTLREIEQWFEDGRLLYLKCLTRDKEGAVAPGTLTAEEKLGAATAATRLRERALRYWHLALLWDDTAKTAAEWKWGTFAAPTDLPQLIMAFESEVDGQVSEACFGPEARTQPYVADQFYGLFGAAIGALERLRRKVAMGDGMTAAS